MIELIWTRTHRIDIEFRVRHLIGRNGFEYMLRQYAKGKIINEWDVGFGQCELEILVIQPGDFE